MNISTKTGYALRALIVLSKSQEEEPVSITEICKRQNLPIKYIEQLFRKLKKKELIKSMHGSKGGYILAKPVSQISLKDVMDAVDENYGYICFSKINNVGNYCIGPPCGLYNLWDEIKNHLENYFDSIKLEHITKNYEV